MPTPILATKLYIPPLRPKAVSRPRLIERLNEGLHRKLTLVSASAGFGKTTLISEWLAGCGRRSAWLSLDEGDNDPARFLAYLFAALQTVAANIGAGAIGMLRSPQPPPAEVVLTALLNELAAVPDPVILVLDDYHVIDAQPVEGAVAFLLERLPPHVHLVIATREDPRLPLARLRARDQLTELRVADLRFTHAEAAGFLNRTMGLTLSAEQIAALEARTEGWIAGLQLAAISMRGQQDAARVLQSFSGSHPYVLDYLVEEVLKRQPEGVQTFLLRTSILDRLCGPLCDAVVHGTDGKPGHAAESPPPSNASVPGQQILRELEQANLFIVPLDNERRWYRYHHLFADLLRQHLQQSVAGATGDAGVDAAELHVRASRWYEDNRLELEAFHHAAAAGDVPRAARLIEGGGMPLHFRGAAVPVLNWLSSLPAATLDARPSLWVMYASTLLFAGRTADVEQKLQAAEAALRGAESDDDDHTRDLVGHMAAIRATLAVTQHQIETIIAESQRALAHLHPDNLPVRTATAWTLGYACQLRGDRAAAGRAYAEAISSSEAIGHLIITIMATIGLGNMQEAENRLDSAARTYRRVLRLSGDPPLPVACEAHLGLARISYEWNDLDAAVRHGQQSARLARQIENTDRLVACEVFLARLQLARGDAAGAADTLAQAEQLARRHSFVQQMPEIAAAQALVLLRQGKPAEAAQLARAHELPAGLARAHLAQGETSAALALLETWRQEAEARDWQDERLKATVLQAVALHADGAADQAMRLLAEALALAEPDGFIRVFVDEGIAMARLLAQAAACGLLPDYTGKLLAACEAEAQPRTAPSGEPSPAFPLVEPLSERELEVLRLIAEGCSNQEIGERLFVALSTVKGHNRNIFDKLQVQNRTKAAARARELGLL